ncbi:MAG: quinone-dependent dihydroorotate dehydrogenase [Bacteroidales bacterium]|nr:quinone-dependent dihydroorotate dehydrogenase [Bacteroidales bacterium]
MYKNIIRPILFLFPPEVAHAITLKGLRIARKVPGFRTLLKLTYSVKSPSLERELFGIKFKNPIGIAAGLDKNGDHYNDFANFGFSFIEIGSITPEPQSGNPRPRLFRLPKDSALINRMGINNRGVQYTADYLSKNPKKIVVAGSLAKNSTTPNELAYKDYERSFSMLYDFVDFFVLNVSCPNVEDLTALQEIDTLSDIIDRLINIRRFNEDSKPILIKVSPDLPKEKLDDIIELALLRGLEGIVATNTTNSREGIKNTPAEDLEEIGKGGLSGAPLFETSLEFVRYIREKSMGLLPIIAVGGIITPEQAQQMLDAGASLIEVYTGFIYNGPAFAKNIIKYLLNSNKND